MQTHSDPESLLRFTDNELSSLESASVEEHLGECGECHAELFYLRAAIEEYELYHRETLKQRIPAPPKPWPKLALDRVTIGMAAAAGNPRRALYSPGYRWTAIAAGLVLIVTLYQLSHGSRVKAAELLSQATAARAGEPVANKRIRVKVAGRAFTRQARMAGADEPAVRGDAAILRQLFKEANYSWEDPFSAQSFAHWREQLSQKEDRVRIVSAAGDRIGRFYEVRTTTPNGILSEANLTLTMTDLRPVYETLQFRNNEWVEITESLPITTPHTSPPSFASEPHPPSAERQVAELGPAEELRVLAALNRIGADLGEPIEVERNNSPQRIVVTGLGIDPARQADIRRAVGALPGVNLHFVEPSAVADTPPGPPRNAPRPQAGPSALVSELEQKLGRREEARTTVDRILEQSDSGLIRAHSLDKLAKRFPESVESGLAPPDRQTLAGLWTTHIRAIEKSRDILARDIGVLTGSLPVSAASKGCLSWQQCTPTFLQTSQELDQVLTRSLAGSDSSAESTASEVRNVFGRWLSTLEDFSSLTRR
jgi:hypothetical protein